MSRVVRHSLYVVALALPVLAPTAARADETTFCNTFITAVPFTISTQGHYCFNKNLSTAITTGAAITINVDFVVLDLNNFKLGGGAAGLGTNAVGVKSTDHSNLTIRNGNIRGFHTAIRLTTSAGTTQNNVIENNVLDGNTFKAIEIDGDSSSVIRNNIITNTGGSTVGSTGWTGIEASLSVVQDNVILNQQNGAWSYGITAGYGVNARNVIQFTYGAFTGGTTYGIAGWYGICRDNSIANADFPTSFCNVNSNNLTTTHNP